jgi:hypothetical protein
MPQLYSLLTGSIYLPDGSVSSSRGFSGSFYGNGSGLTGITTASYIEFVNVKNKPTLVSSSIQIDHNATTNYSTNRHIDHSQVTISGIGGLIGGGDLTTSRAITLNVGDGQFINGVIAALPNGTVSGSAQLSGFSGSYFAHAIGEDITLLEVTHSLNSRFPTVQAYQYVAPGIYDTVIPAGIQSTGVNTLKITFAGSFSGSVVIRT